MLYKFQVIHYRVILLEMRNAFCISFELSGTKRFLAVFREKPCLILAFFLRSTFMNWLTVVMSSTRFSLCLI